MVHFRDDHIPCYQASPKVYETLACKSFLISDRQRDVVSQFENGKHLVLFNDITDLKEKISYYLSKPGERKRIAAQGHDEVLQKHTYQDRIEHIINTIMVNDNGS